KDRAKSFGHGPGIVLNRKPRDPKGSEETMTQIQTLETRGQGNVIGRIMAFLYGIVAYVVFFVTFLYAIGFVEDLAVPKTIDGGTATPTAPALIVNLVLMSIFAVQHRDR